MVCVAIFTNLSPNGSENSGSLGCLMNMLPPQDCSLLNKLLGNLGLQVFTGIALFGFGGLIESFCQKHLLMGVL